MKRYWLVVSGLLILFTALYLAVERFSLPFLQDPGRWMNQGSVAVAVAGVALLLSDVLLPVPSSFVMIANGMFYGVALGSLLSLVGYVGSALLGFLIGRRSAAALDRLVPLEEQARANQLLVQWGWLAVMATRPLPLLAETTSIMAGASSMSWRAMFLGTVGGSLPITLLYAITGATAARLDSLPLAFGLAVLIGGIFLLTGRIFRMNLSASTQADKISRAHTPTE